mmetsp:Transcript_48702/g.139256  ORF Transcript_48702/g.139256 Transcript_48702/m.139256 type:complete len:80 (+) Transcript_48702:855-1094(+)
MSVALPNKLGHALYSCTPDVLIIIFDTSNGCCRGDSIPLEFWITQGGNCSLPNDKRVIVQAGYQCRQSHDSNAKSIHSS